MITRHAIGSGRALFILPGGRFLNATNPLQEEVMDMTTNVYAAEGATIRKLPVETPTENGVKISIGFPVCTLSEWCDDQAEAVAEIMNRGEAYEANQARISELEDRLRDAIRIAAEAAEEWDKAPSGMRAGKILLALAGHVPGYRADTDAVHAALSIPS